MLPNNPLAHAAADPLLTADQAASATGLKPRTWRRLFDRRLVPLVRVSGRLYIRQSDMLAYLEASTEQATQPGAGQ